MKPTTKFEDLKERASDVASYIGASGVEDIITKHVTAEGPRKGANFAPPPISIAEEYNPCKCYISGKERCGDDDCACIQYENSLETKIYD